MTPGEAEDAFWKTVSENEHDDLKDLLEEIQDVIVKSNVPKAITAPPTSGRKKTPLEGTSSKQMDKEDLSRGNETTEKTYLELKKIWGRILEAEGSPCGKYAVTCRKLLTK